MEGETHWEIHNRDTVRVTERNTHTETHTLKGTNTELAMHTERDKHTHTHFERHTCEKDSYCERLYTHNIQRNTHTERETKPH